MKKLLLLGAALLGLCAVVPLAQADDSPDYKDDRPVERHAPRYYEGRVVEGPRCYLPPPPPPVFIAPVPRVVFYGGYPRYYHHRYYRPYGYGYGYAPSVHIGVGF